MDPFQVGRLCRLRKKREHDRRPSRNRRLSENSQGEKIMIGKKDMNPHESSPVSGRTCLQKRNGMRLPWPVMAIFRRSEKLGFDLSKRAAGLMVCALLCSAPAFAQGSITSFDAPESFKDT